MICIVLFENIILTLKLSLLVLFQPLLRSGSLNEKGNFHQLSIDCCSIGKKGLAPLNEFCSFPHFSRPTPDISLQGT